MICIYAKHSARRRNVVDCRIMHSVCEFFFFTFCKMFGFFCFWRVVDCMFSRTQHANTHTRTKIPLSLTWAEIVTEKRNIGLHNLYHKQMTVTATKCSIEQPTTAAVAATPPNRMLWKESRKGKRRTKTKWARDRQRDRESERLILHNLPNRID